MWVRVWGRVMVTICVRYNDRIRVTIRVWDGMGLEGRRCNGIGLDGWDAMDGMVRVLQLG